MMIFLLGSGPDPGLVFLSWRFTLVLRVFMSFETAVSADTEIELGLPTVPISSGQSRFSAFCPDRIFASVGTIRCPDFPKYKIKVTRLCKTR